MNIFQKSKIAEEYDAYYLSDFGKQVDKIEKEMISGLLKNIPRGEMIDVGCGTGHWTEFFVDKGFKVKGIDASTAMLNIARNKKINADFLQADSEDLPFEDESQHFVASIAMLEFVENREKVIDEIYRILKKGGRFILGALNADSVPGRNKDEDEVFKHARFWKKDEIDPMFSRFELLNMKQAVYIDENFSIRDRETDKTGIDPVFIAALFQKI
ncbi:MAG: class I SAM-dependent methyltransferase [Bacteroidota bacterium]